MAEVSTGIRAMLANPMVYDSFQAFVGAYAWRHRVIRDFVLPKVQPHHKILDIGCGTCKILEFLPESVEYHGYDRNEAYINYARKRFVGRNAQFECRAVGSDSECIHHRYDIALAFGLAHHLEDSEVRTLIRDIRNLLAPGGMLFLLDPVYCQEQSRLARYVVSTDRGKNVRTEEEYLKLYESEFRKVSIHLDLKPLWIPYTGVTVSCSVAA